MPESWKADDSVRAVYDLASSFVSAELLPHRDKWEAQHHVDRDVWLKAGELGLLCCSIPEEYGGGGGTIAHDLAICEAQARAGETSWGNMVHSGIVAHYLLAYGTEDQKRRWLPRLASGEMIGAIAMTEPGTGSDLQGIQTKAVRDGDVYVIDGAKTFISNGHLADLIVVAARTDAAKGARHLAGRRGDGRLPGVRPWTAPREGRSARRRHRRVLLRADVRVPADNLLGGAEGQGFAQLMNQLPQERLLISVLAVAGMEAAMEQTVDYVKQRRAFGQSIWDFQNTKFTLAEGATTTRVARVFLDECIDLHLEGRLDAATAAMAKWWLTEQQCAVDRRMRATARRLRLHAGIPHRPHVPVTPGCRRSTAEPTRS